MLEQAPHLTALDRPGPSVYELDAGPDGFFQIAGWRSKLKELPSPRLRLPFPDWTTGWGVGKGLHGGDLAPLDEWEVFIVNGHWHEGGTFVAVAEADGVAAVLNPDQMTCPLPSAASAKACSEQQCWSVWR